MYKIYLLINCLKLVIGTLIDHLLASDSVKLIVVTINNQLANVKQFKLVVVSLHDQNIEPTVWLLSEQKVVVAINGGWMDLLITPWEQNLVVVTIYYQTIGNLLLHVVRAIVIVNN